MKSKNKISLFLLLAFATVMSAWAQSSANVVRGTVTAAVDGETLISVSVMEIDASNRIVGVTITNYDGEYVIQVNNTKNKLRFKYLGFQTVDKPIGTNKVINVQMEEETHVIADVEITAKAMTTTGSMNIPQREVSMAMQKISAEEFDGIQVASIDDALQGRIAGLDIVNVSGEPGSGMSMRIRGTTSINANSEPLIVINDVPFETEIDKNFDFATANDEQYAQLINVNPDDIESITVLKDAASTAMWGSKGANGVLLIYTKKGKAGPTRVTYSYAGTRSMQPQGLRMLNGDDYTMLMKQAYYNPNLTSASSGVPELNYDTNFTEYEMYNNNTDWRKAVSRVGWTHDNNLTITGGGEKVTFRVSAAYYHQTGTVIGQLLDRLSLRSNIQYQVSNRIRFTADVSYTYSNNDKNYEDELSVAYKKMPNLSVYEQDLEGNTLDPYYHIRLDSKLESGQKNLSNPVAVANLAMNNTKSYRTSPQFNLMYDFLDPQANKGTLRLTATASFDINSNRKATYYPKEAANLVYNSTDLNHSQQQDSESLSVFAQGQLNYHPQFSNPDHYVQFNLSGRIQMSNSNSLGRDIYGLPSSNITSASTQAVFKNASNSFSESRSANLSWQAHYSYKGRYVISGTINRQGSSKFGDNFRYGFFPAVSAKWIISDENFFGVLRPYVSMLAPRYSIGVNGNEPSEEYIHLSRYGKYDYYLDIPAMKPLNMKLANLRWEKTTAQNFGVDLELFQGRYTLDYNYYIKHTTDLLFKNLSISSTSGYPTITNRNSGTMDNTGWELNIGIRDLVKINKFRVDFNFNFSNNQNKIKYLTDEALATYNPEYTYKNGEYLSRIQIDNPVGAIYGFRYLGVYEYGKYDPEHPERTCPIVRNANGDAVLDAQGNTKPMYFAYGKSSQYEFKAGDAMYEDINHDGSIDELDIVYLGSSLAKINGGFGFNFRWRQFSVNTFFNYRIGNKVVNAARMNAENMYTNDNQSVAVNWRWRKEGDVTEMPRALYNYGYNWLGSDRYVEDASFLRFKYLSLSYNAPKEVTKVLHMNQLSATVTIQNVAVMTKYTGVDPEVGYGSMSVAKDGSKTPRSKDVLLRLRIGF